MNSFTPVAIVIAYSIPDILGIADRIILRILGMIFANKEQDITIRGYRWSQLREIGIDLWTHIFDLDNGFSFDNILFLGDQGARSVVQWLGKGCIYPASKDKKGDDFSQDSGFW